MAGEVGKARAAAEGVAGFGVAKRDMVW